MRFTPKTKEELEAENLIPKGEYDATVLDAEETTSKKSSKPMFKLKLGVYHGDRQEWVFDYIVCDTYKLPNIARACGLFYRYESGELTAEELKGRDLKVKIGIEEASGDFPAKNTVKDYVFEKLKAENKTAEGLSQQVAAGGEEDEIPF